MVLLARAYGCVPPRPGVGAPVRDDCDATRPHLRVCGLLGACFSCGHMMRIDVPDKATTRGGLIASPAPSRAGATRWASTAAVAVAAVIAGCASTSRTSKYTRGGGASASTALA